MNNADFMPKLQSAMEYLTTYGWAVLVIATVLILLIKLNLFNLSIFAPRAPPGACQVYRPNGPGTTQFLNLQGMCNGELPEYVLGAKGVGDYVIVSGSESPTSMLNITGNTITITAWVFVKGSPYHDVVDKEYQYGMKIDINNYPHSCAPSNVNSICLEWDTANNWTGQSYPIPSSGFNQWMFLAVSMNGNQKLWYANGKFLGNMTTNTKITFVDSNLTIGAISPGWTGYGDAEWFNGSIANVQIYNTSLSANDIKLLYTEGIGGAPVNFQNLVGWWPLNGNTNDYSGNQDGGYVRNVSYSGTWLASYPLT
jgi:hypothetical protein